MDGKATLDSCKNKIVEITARIDTLKEELGQCLKEQEEWKKKLENGDFAGNGKMPAEEKNCEEEEDAMEDDEEAWMSLDLGSKDGSVDLAEEDIPPPEPIEEDV